MMARLGWLVALIACAPGLLVAQTLVRVESHGIPVAGAELTAWDSVGRLAAGRTDGLGVARLVAARAIAPGAFLLVRRMGFAPVRVAFTGGDSLTVALTDVPRVLPVLATETKRLNCSSSAEPAADSIWRLSAARYTLGATRHYLSWTGFDVEETVTGEQRGYGEEGDFTQSRAHSSRPQSTGNVALFFVDPPPYGDFERHINVVGEYWQWRFAELERIAAEHFLSEHFHERHTFRILGRSEDATILGFCPRERGEADIEGELQVGSDSLLRSARWFFRVPHDDEDVGGEATFGVAHFEGATYLVAVRGSSWRRAGRNLYHQHRFENSQWRLGHTLRESKLDPPRSNDITSP